jgi:prepilin-type N-terminal cleavage/methylation domain-containing protein
MRHPIARRSGFTLIELLVVIAVISLLTAITFGLFRAANTSRNKSKSLGGIQAIAMACQSFRKTYGDFPCSPTGTDERFRRDLLDQLIGRRVLRIATPGSLPTLLNFDDSSLPGDSTKRQMRSFLTFQEISTNDDTKIGANDWRAGATAASREFVDAWGNPYDYRYRVLTAAKYPDWKSPNFLFVCASANYVEAAAEGDMLSLGEYWDPAAAGGTTMLRSGIVPATYFEENEGTTGPFRADNLVNWSN